MLKPLVCFMGDVYFEAFPEFPLATEIVLSIVTGATKGSCPLVIRPFLLAAFSFFETEI